MPSSARPAAHRKGIAYLLAASFTFALSTVFLKLSTAAPYHVPPMVATFARFLVSFVIVAVYSAAARETLRPRRFGPVFWRAFYNTFAVILFFAGITYTTVTKANILNLTYPVFVFLVAPSITGEASRPRHLLFLMLAIAGSAFIVLPGAGFSPAAVNAGDLLALSSGVVSALAISILRQARKEESTSLILFHQMAFGTIVTGLLMLPVFALPHGRGLLYVALTALLSAAGQVCLTAGYRYIEAAAGSIVLGSGILFAAFLGVGLMHDPLTPSLIVGAVLIFLALAGVGGLFGRQRSA